MPSSGAVHSHCTTGENALGGAFCSHVGDTSRSSSVALQAPPSTPPIPRPPAPPAPPAPAALPVVTTPATSLPAAHAATTPTTAAIAAPFRMLLECISASFYVLL